MNQQTSHVDPTRRCYLAGPYLILRCAVQKQPHYFFSPFFSSCCTTTECAASKMFVPSNTGNSLQDETSEFYAHHIMSCTCKYGNEVFARCSRCEELFFCSSRRNFSANESSKPPPHKITIVDEVSTNIYSIQKASSTDELEVGCFNYCNLPEPNEISKNEHFLFRLYKSGPGELRATLCLKF